MKELQGRASATVPAPIETSFAVVYAVEAYPRWNRDLFREVEVLERDQDGGPSKARAKLRVARGRFVREFELLVAIRAERPNAVYIERIPHEPSDEERLQLTWTLRANGSTSSGGPAGGPTGDGATSSGGPAGGGPTDIALTFAAALSSLPSFLPLGGAGDQIARSLVDGVARALR